MTLTPEQKAAAGIEATREAAEAKINQHRNVRTA